MLETLTTGSELVASSLQQKHYVVCEAASADYEIKVRTVQANYFETTPGSWSEGSPLNVSTFPAFILDELKITDLNDEYWIKIQPTDETKGRTLVLKIEAVDDQTLIQGMTGSGATVAGSKFYVRVKLESKATLYKVGFKHANSTFDPNKAKFKVTGVIE